MTQIKRTFWFEVDKEGLSKLMKRGGTRAFLVFELVQNAWDEASKRVNITIEYSKTAQMATISVSDDNPDGFKNLAHAYTLFAESDKKSDPSKRGRFNIGEKLVFACCITATIITTKGSIYFNCDGTRNNDSARASKKGSYIYIGVKMSHTEYLNIVKETKRLIPPKGIKTTLNGVEILYRKKIASFEAVLATEISDEEGNLRPTERKCVVNIYEPLDKPTIYEMGIPVVSVDDKYDIDIQQKVPLNIDRTNVTPAYLRRLRTKVLNETVTFLTKEEATQPWIQEASSQKECSAAAITQVIDLKYGIKRVSYDPSDPEANKLAMSRGYTVVTGGALSKGQWNNIREAEAMLPAGQVTPSPKPYGDGPLLKLIPIEKWSEQMKRVATFASQLAYRLMDKKIRIDITNDPGLKFSATYGPGGPLVLSKRYLGNNFFDSFPHNREVVVSLLIHEFSHEYSRDHLSSQYHQALCDLGAKAVELAIKEPELFI